MYIFQKMSYVYILNIFIYNINYMNINIDMKIHVNIFKIYTVYVCIYIYTEHTHILCKQKLLFCVQLITINRLTALIILLKL